MYSNCGALVQTGCAFVVLHGWPQSVYETAATIKCLYVCKGALTIHCRSGRACVLVRNSDVVPMNGCV